MPFETNVFVNCPFDDDYMPLLRPILFTIVRLGLSPRIALESMDSGSTRISKILSLVEDSRFAIHDLSRIRASRKGEFFRLNMPFELGLDIGCRVFKGGRRATKKCLILEAERFRYQAAISDLSNSDIAAHGDDPARACAEVRNWLNNELRLQAPGPTAVWSEFNDFMAENYDQMRARGYSESDVKRLPIPELVTAMQTWAQRQ
jgi:hypothetical protein